MSVTQPLDQVWRPTAAEALASITEARAAALVVIGTAGDTEELNVTNKGTEQVGLVEDAGDAILAPSTGTLAVAEAAALAAVEAESDAQIVLVAAEGAAQIADIIATPGSDEYASTTNAVSNGVWSVAVTAGGSGGTDNTYQWTTSGGAGSNAAGYLTVAGGAITSVVVTNRGYGYTSDPTIVIAGTHNVTGHTLTPSRSQNQTAGSYFIVKTTDGFSVYTVTSGTTTSLVDTYPTYTAAVLAASRISLWPDPWFQWSPLVTSPRAGDFLLYSANTSYDNRTWDGTYLHPYGKGAWVYASASSDLMVMDTWWRGRGADETPVVAGDVISVGALVIASSGTVSLSGRFMDSISGVSHTYNGAQINGSVATAMDGTVKVLKLENATVPSGANGFTSFLFDATASDFKVIAFWVVKGSTSGDRPPARQSTYERERTARALQKNMNGGDWVAKPTVGYTSISAVASSTSTSTTTRTSGFYGWGQELTPNAYTFNTIAIGSLTGDGLARFARVIVKTGAAGSASAGTIVAVGETPLVAGALTYANVYIALRHPTTGAFRTLTDADLGAGKYFVGIYFVDAEGAPCRMDQPKGTMPNRYAESYYLGALTHPVHAGWSALTGDGGIAVDHYLMVAPVESHEFSDAALAAIETEFADTVGAAEWAFQGAVDYTSASIVAASTSRSITARTYDFTGWGQELTPAAYTFNAICLREGQTISAGVKTIWAVVKIGAAGSASAGTVVAQGSVVVDTSATTFTDVYIPLVDPITGAFKTLTDADLGAGKYFVGIFFKDEAAANKSMFEPVGTMPNRYAESYYITSANGLTSSWSGYSDDGPIAVDHALLVSPVNSYGFTQNAIDKIAEYSGATTVETAALVAFPPVIYGVQGRETNIYFDNLVYADRTKYGWNITQGPGYGEQQDERWTYTPAGAVTSTITVDLHDLETGDQISTETASLLTAATAASPKTWRLMILGDSTTNAAVAGGELLTLEAADANVSLTMVGTKGTAPNVHEGNSGWTVARWYQPSGGDIASNPFSDAGAVFSMTYGMANGLSAFATPTHVIINLGINDCFSKTTDSQASDQAAADIVKLEAMIASIQAYGPAIKIGVCAPIPPSSNQDSFGANYTVVQTRWRYKRNILLYTQALIDAFSGRTGSLIYVVPINVNIDPVLGFPKAAQTLANSRVLLTGTYATSALMLADLTPADGALYYVTDAAKYYVKVGASAKGTWREALAADGVVRRESNSVHPASPGRGYYQIADTYWAWLNVVG